MIAEGQVTPDHVGYNDLPWKYSAGTPNILGVIVSAEACGSSPISPAKTKNQPCSDPTARSSTRSSDGP